MLTQEQREALQCVLAEVDDGGWREDCITARAIDIVRAMLDTQKTKVGPVAAEEIEQLRIWKEEAEKILQLISEEHQNTDEIECSFWSDLNAQYRGHGGTWVEEDCTCHVLPLRRFREKNK